MQVMKSTSVVALSFVVGFSAAWVFASKGRPGTAPSDFRGKAPKEAAAALLTVAEAQAESGTWELVGVGRVYYLSGDKARGQALFDRATAKKPGRSDWRRIARVYAESKEWDKAEAALQKGLALEPNDDTILTEIGCYRNLKGDRAGAEEMFEKALAVKSDDNWNTINAAASYLDMLPH